MAVYVDPLFEVDPGMITGFWPFPTACHLTADSHQELIDFAQLLGLRISWIQHVGLPSEHFDLTEGKRTLALRRGARAISADQAVEYLIKRAQDARHLRPEGGQ